VVLSREPVPARFDGLVYPCHTSRMTTRINARVDPDLARKVRALRDRTGRSTTEIVKASIEAYYDSVTGSANPAALLSELIGCANGPADLSATYKRHLTESMVRKARA
jgi:hypothetical protein